MAYTDTIVSFRAFLFFFILMLGLTQPLKAEDALTTGIHLSQQGEHEAAILEWQSALTEYRQAGKSLQAGKLLARMAESYLALGQVTKAIEQLSDGIKLVDAAGDQEWLARLNIQAGGAYLHNSSFKEAQNHLERGLEIARSLHRPDIEAVALNNLGNLFFQRNDFARSHDYYTESGRLAGQTEQHELTARVALNHFTVLLKLEQYKRARLALKQVLAAEKQLPASHDTAYLLIRFARANTQLAGYLPAHKSELTATAYQAYENAAKMAKSLNDWRSASYAYGYMGNLYEQAERYDDALELTQRAIFYIQQGYAPEVEYQWEWQAGRLHLAAGDLDKAIQSYGRSVQHLRTIRIELTAGYESSELSYRDAVKPVFLQYTDLLLKRGQSYEQDDSKRQQYFKQARLTVELLKAAELEDYFKDDCVAAAQARVKKLEEVLSSSTAIIYPIVLSDRLELLVSYHTGLVKYSVPVSADELRQTVTDFRAKLEKRTTRQYLRPARQLYDWLIRPIKQDLDAKSIDTLVYVPDAVFRNIPFSALNDGEKYLVDHYALAITPGLDLTDPTPIKRGDMTLLLNGLTESVQGFPALYHVPQEIEEIRSLYGGKTLINKNFSLSNVENELSDNEYSVVHIASHGKFAGKVKDSFLLTYENKMSMDDLEKFVGSSKFRFDKPIELLTLSACESAAGDDMAGLGLASIAIKAGARSALATLWSVDDAATSELVMEFYRQLQNPEISKARALQQAQLRSLDDKRYHHPGYWAPFLLIGNWL